MEIKIIFPDAGGPSGTAGATIQIGSSESSGKAIVLESEGPRISSAQSTASNDSNDIDAGVMGGAARLGRARSGADRWRAWAAGSRA